MARALKDISSQYGNLVLCYIDDILIATTTVDDHIIRLEQVFNCLRKAGLKLKASKCKLFEQEIIFLGRRISEGQIRPDHERVIKIQEWSEPRSKEDVMSFLGLAGYYREFVKDFAAIASPLTELIQKDAEFKFTHEARSAFEQLKQALASDPVVSLPNDEGEFVLDTDASQVAMGAVLQQRQKDVNGVERLKVIAYGSKTLTKSQRNYSAAKL